MTEKSKKKAVCFDVKPVALSVALAFAVSGSAFALPQGGAVTVGSSTITTSGPAMTIQQATNSATYNWQSFNIGAAESVHFQQPTANSIALNYVLGNANSLIDGTLTSCHFQK